MGWDGMGWDGWDGMGWDVTGCDLDEECARAYRCLSFDNEHDRVRKA